MHTFFINTTGKELENYADILEIQHETRKLVSLNCPITEWNQEEAGYRACVRRMGELIDSYKDINNRFNLIIFVDLIQYARYTTIPMDKHRERYACLKAMRTMLKHYIYETMYQELDRCGRIPGETLIIFEENQLPRDADETTEDGKNMIRNYVKACLGLPDCDRLREMYLSFGETEVTTEAFCQKTEAAFPGYLAKDMLSTYKELTEIFLQEAKTYSQWQEPVNSLCDRIIEQGAADDRSIYSVSFVTNRRAGSTNKQEHTRRDLRLSCYILDCVETQTVVEDSRNDLYQDSVRVKQFPAIDWDQLVEMLSAKGALMRKKHRETQRISDSFTDLKMAPPLYAFDHERFVLDAYGKKGKKFTVQDAEKAPAAKDSQAAEADTAIRSGEQKVVTATVADSRNLFGKDEFIPFDYEGEEFTDGIRGNAKVEDYVQAAKKLREHHLDYLKKLKVHVSDVLSNYAGRSAENVPALLPKRKVSLAEEDFDDAAKEYRYAKPGRQEETKKLDTVKTIAQDAYESTLLHYMEFCAARSVAVTDIEEQCNWFVSRVYQIRASLHRIQAVALGMLIAMLVLYIPFVALQWEQIIQSSQAIVMALCSVAVPLVLTVLVVAALTIAQRKKYKKAWKEFKEKSDACLEENRIAAEKFDQLLATFIPSLRWVYEYKLDVEFYAECCKIARAKINHHTQKLHDRVVTIGNILEDLEAPEPEYRYAAESGNKNLRDAVDYNVSFCSGTKNKKFYSIVDPNMACFKKPGKEA